MTTSAASGGLNMNNYKQELFQKAKFLYNRAKKSDLDEEQCNELIDDFNDFLREDLRALGHDWVDDFDELDPVHGFFSEASEETISDALNNIKRILTRACQKLGVDIAEEVISKKEPAHTINIIQQQSQTASASASIDFSHLVDELEEEIKRPVPDKSKIKLMLQKALKAGGYIAPKILEIFLNNLDKIKFGGLI